MIRKQQNQSLFVINSILKIYWIPKSEESIFLSQQKVFENILLQTTHKSGSYKKNRSSAFFWERTETKQQKKSYGYGNIDLG